MFFGKFLLNSESKADILVWTINTAAICSSDIYQKNSLIG